VNVLGTIWAPFCVQGTLTHFKDVTVFKSSKFNEINIAELMAEATQSPFGKGLETVVDTTVRNSFEIPAEKLDPALQESFKPSHWCSRSLSFYGLDQLAPRMELEVRPYKLVIYQEGGHFDEHRDSVRGENHIGTLVLILNSEFTGGELVVSQGKEECSISRPNEWIAMYGDCPHRVTP
jgi:hypothetical protein